MSPLKAERFLWLIIEEEVRNLKHKDSTPVAGGKEPMARNSGGL